MTSTQTPEAAGPKTTWPELSGKTYAEAARGITADDPQLEVSKVLPGQPMSRDFNPCRVRILVDDNDVVIQTPSVG